MGYCVDHDGGTAVIKAADLPEAYRLLCDLNKSENDHLKRGGFFSGGKYTALWFSWMDADYPSTCPDVVSILEMLGFEDNDLTEDGDLIIGSYSKKSGQEELFLRTIGHLVQGHMDWRGEGGALWRWQFGPGGMRELTGRISYE